MHESTKKIQLHGFNNLTKSLSFNIYDVCYARTEEAQQEYIAYIDEEYNADRLTDILTKVSDIVGATVLNISGQDYEPQGASVVILIAEEDVCPSERKGTEAEPGPVPTTRVGHLDKSHITVHSYPETHPHNGISTFRVDIDVSTCGRISPLRALNFLIHSFDSDVVAIDYRVRGFTRDIKGKKHFIDHKIASIQSFIDDDTKDRYHAIDVNVYQENIFHTKMMLKDFDLDNYLFGTAKKELDPFEKKEVKKVLKREILEMFYGKNLKK